MKRRDDGAVAAFELAIAAGLILIPALALAASLPALIETRETAELAAEEAARAYVLAGDDEAGLAAARYAATTVARNHGAFDVSVRVVGQLQRGGEVTAFVTTSVPTLRIPGLGEFAARELTVSHIERVDDYRSFP